MIVTLDVSSALAEKAAAAKSTAERDDLLRRKALVDFGAFDQSKHADWSGFFAEGVKVASYRQHALHAYAVARAIDAAVLEKLATCAPSDVVHLQEVLLLNRERGCDAIKELLL